MTTSWRAPLRPRTVPAERSQATRGRSWLKVKCNKRQELVIGGFTEGQGSRSGFGALLLGVYERDELRYAGKVGTGFDEAALNELRARYLLTYSPNGGSREGWHDVKVTLKNTRGEVTARPGYFAQ